ncbi:hypothetical protein QFC22_001737 [Naganishia vaughanmartiniae]|uniref:Uncharacterized protein n=1 Tax=Naganishia vaughanmartiniae TaxID=1424756 RepID=A0ACC2XFA5_9TREE|nr:hypothetical protein QFC22_001737 [Naganishia vaughanmartiniae]
MHYVYDPLKPLLEDMMTTVREHSPCLNDPMDDTDDSDQDEQFERFNRRQQLTQQPTWNYANPSMSLASRLHGNEKEEEKLERDMSLMQISDEQFHQLVSPAVIGHFEGFQPNEETQEENEIRRNSGSTLNHIDAMSQMAYQDSATTTSVDLSFFADGSGGNYIQPRLPEDNFLRRRRPEHNIVNNAEASSLLSNDSQCTIVYIPSSIRELTSSRSNAGPDEGIIPALEEGLRYEDESHSGASSPDWTDASLVDASSYAVSSFSGSPVSNRGHMPQPDVLRQRLMDASAGQNFTRGSSPALSASSWEMLRSPEEVVPMSTSLHSMDTSIVLETYPPFDEYNRYTIRNITIGNMNLNNHLHNVRRRPSSQMSNPAPSEVSESSWTDGDTSSRDPFVNV